MPESPDLQGLPRGRSPRRPLEPFRWIGTDFPLEARAPLEAWEAAASSNEQRSQALVAIERLWGSIDERSEQDLVLGDMGLRQWPPCLVELFPDLTGLYVQGNRFDETPDLGALTELQWLDMSEGELEAAPELLELQKLQALDLHSNRFTEPPDLSNLAELETLDLEDNRLQLPPDMSRCAMLERLNLSHNCLVEMPDVRGLDFLDSVLLAGNRLETVPAWIAELPEGMVIDLSGNPLSAGTLAFLQGLDTGPVIHYGQEAFLEDRTPARLPEQVSLWLASQYAMSPDRCQSLRERWAEFEREPDADEFARLLRALRRTADFRSGDASRHAFAQRVAEVLDALARDAETRQLCFAAAREGLGACGDRAALTFADIEVAARANLLAGQPDPLLKFARGLHRLALVDEIAREDLSARRGGVDPVEVALVYRVRLAEALGLPAQPEFMLHERCANLGEAQLAHARRSVLAREQASPEAVVESVAQQPFWQAVLRQQPACAEEFAELLEQRTQRTEALMEAYEQERAGAMQEDLADPDSTLALQHAARFAEIGKGHNEDEQGVYRQFTRIAMDRVAAGQTACDAHPTPGHVIAVAKLGDIAVQVERLVRQGQVAEAGAQADRLLHPRLVAQLHGQPPSDMGPQEAGVMDVAKLRYMELLKTLVAERLLDAKQVFDRLSGAGMADDETPYLLHLASRIGAGGPRDMPGAAPQLAHAAVQLLDTLAGEMNARAYMREALLTQTHTRHTDKLYKEKYDKYVDFFSRLLLSGSPSTPGEASLVAARELDAADLLPKSEEIHAVRLSDKRATKFERVRRMAAQTCTKVDPAPAEKLDEVVRATGRLDVVRARAADARQLEQQRAMQRAQRLREDARDSIYAAVSEAVDEQWAIVERQTRKGLAPSWWGRVLNPIGASAFADAAQSVPRMVPDGLAGLVFKALVSTSEGEAVLDRLATGMRPYRASEHPRFHGMLQAMAGKDVTTMLEKLDITLRTKARTMIAASAATTGVMPQPSATGSSAERAEHRSPEGYAAANQPVAARTEPGMVRKEMTRQQDAGEFMASALLSVPGDPVGVGRRPASSSSEERGRTASRL